MFHIKKFAFNPFGENTYVLYNDNRACAIIDAGCSNADEEKVLSDFIKMEGLKVTMLLQTHCHIDHVYGLHFCQEQFNLRPLIHESETDLLAMASGIASSYGFGMAQPPVPAGFLKEGEKIRLEDDELDIIHTPGHSPGSLCFISHAQKLVIGGDVLFRESIGRSDLPGGDYPTLEASIRQKLYVLPDDYTVYPGHGPETTIGYEKKNNPFVNG